MQRNNLASAYNFICLLQQTHPRLELYMNKCFYIILNTMFHLSSIWEANFLPRKLYHKKTCSMTSIINSAKVSTSTSRRIRHFSSQEFAPTTNWSVANTLLPCSTIGVHFETWRKMDASIGGSNPLSYAMNKFWGS